MEIISLTVNLILGSGIIGLLFFYKSKQRKEAAAATIMELDATETQINHLSKQLKEAYTELDHMQDIIDSKRHSIIELMRRVGELELKLLSEERSRQQAEYHRCLNSECTNRQPVR